MTNNDTSETVTMTHEEFAEKIMDRQKEQAERQENRLIPGPNYNGARVSLPMERFEELTKKEALLHQIENAVGTSLPDYEIKDAMRIILSVLPKWRRRRS